MTNPTTPDDLAVVVPTAPFPDFEGERVTEAVLKFAGEVVLRHPVGHHGKLVIITEVEVGDVGHPGTDGGVKRVEKGKTATGYGLPGRIGKRILSAARHADRVADDAGQGRTAIEGLLAAEIRADGLDLTTDGAGVVLTPDELAAAGLDDKGLDPLVVIAVPWAKLDGRKRGVGQKLLYPDELPTLTAPPSPGDQLSDVEGELVVVEILDASSGETVGEWTWDDEKARMLEAEKAAEAAEAAESGGLTDGQMVNRAPWDGYDGAVVGAVVGRLLDIVDTWDELKHVAVYEEAHKNRAGVLKAVEQRRAELAQAEAQQQAMAADPPDELVDDDLVDLDLPPLDDDLAGSTGEEG